MQTTDRPQNFPHATDAQWGRAWQIVHAAATRAGHDDAMAADIAQNAMAAVRKRRYRDRCPIDPIGAARAEVASRRRYGWWPLMDRDQARRFRADMTEQERAAELATMATYRERSANLTPAQMAERAEAWNGIQRAAAMRLAGAESVLDAVLASQGVGPSACVHEAGHTPSVYGSRRRDPLPQTGCPGLHTACDPAAGSHARAAAAAARHNAEAIASR